MRLKYLLPVLLIAATFGLYWPSLHHAPFFDDVNFFEAGLLQQIFLDGFVFHLRWLPYFMTAWVDLIFEDHLFAQRCINVGLHLMTAFVLHSLTLRIADHVAPHPYNRRAALAAALLFLLHPLAVYAVGYLIQRTILMAALFGLMTLSTFFDGLVTRKKAYFIFSALFYFLSSFSKEHALLIPAAALALTPLAGPLNREIWRQLALPLALYLVIAILVVVKSQGILGAVYEPFAESLVRQHGSGNDALQLWGLSVMTQATLFFKYVGLALIPNPGWMSIDIRVPFGQPEYLLGVLGLAAYTVTTVFWLLKGGRRGLAGYALLAPLLLFAVEFSTVRIQEPFVLYRSYLWIAPLFMAIPVISHALPDRLFWPVVLAIALAFAFASSDRLRSFSSTYALWDDAVKKLPDEQALGATRVYANRGVQLMKRGELVAAIDDFTRALHVDPGYRIALKGRAFAYLKQGKYEAAIAEADGLIRFYPDEGDGYIVRGKIHRNWGDWNRAKTDFEFGCQKMKNPDVCVSLLTVDRLRAVQSRVWQPIEKPL